MSFHHQYPQYVYINTTNLCNARCPFCPLFVGDHQFDRKVSPAALMASDLFENIVAEISSWKQRPLVITLAPNGETLQDPNIGARVGSIQKSGLNDITTILTNGQYLTEQISRSLLGAQIGMLLVGFDGATKKTYEAHRVRCNYEKVLGNIAQFVRLRGELGGTTAIRLKFVRTTENEHEIEAAHRLFSAMLDYRIDSFEDALAMDWGDSPTNYGGYYFFNQVSGRSRVSGCQLADPALNINTDGTVAACCWDYNLEVSRGGFGNVKDRPMLDIWRGQRRGALTDALADVNGALPSKCQSCIWAHEMDEIPESLIRISDALLESKWPTGLVYRLDPSVEATR